MIKNAFYLLSACRVSGTQQALVVIITNSAEGGPVLSLQVGVREQKPHGQCGDGSGQFRGRPFPSVLLSWPVLPGPASVSSRAVGPVGAQHPSDFAVPAGPFSRPRSLGTWPREPQWLACRPGLCPECSGHGGRAPLPRCPRPPARAPPGGSAAAPRPQQTPSPTAPAGLLPEHLSSPAVPGLCGPPARPPSASSWSCLPLRPPKGRGP